MSLKRRRTVNSSASRRKQLTGIVKTAREKELSNTRKTVREKELSNTHHDIEGRKDEILETDPDTERRSTIIQVIEKCLF